jgi:hypothetical protein
MAEDERYCSACKEPHLAATWYSRRIAVGKTEHLCGEGYFAQANKAGWFQSHPRQD